jgi:hypothetical protein
VQDLIVERRNGLLEAQVDGEMVGLKVDSGTCYGFNATATRIWSLIAEPKRLSEIRDLLLEEFEVTPEACERDVHNVLVELEKDGLVDLKPVTDGG